MLDNIKKVLGLMTFALVAVIGISFAGGEKAAAASACDSQRDYSFCTYTDATNYYSGSSYINASFDSAFDSAATWVSELRYGTTVLYTKKGSTDSGKASWSFYIMGRQSGKYSITTNLRSSSGTLIGATTMTVNKQS